MRKIRNRKRITALVLSFVMMASLLPQAAFASAEQKLTGSEQPVAATSSEQPAAESTPEQIVAAMSLEQKIGQMIMPAFRKWSGSDGDATGGASAGTSDPVNVTTMNDEIAGAVSDLGLGGVILFAENIENTEQTVRLVNDFQEAATAADSLSRIPMLISTDQEGGSVCRLKCGTCLCGNMALAAGGSLKDTETSADIIKTELEALGINVDFAPVMDINNNPNNPVIGVRSFSDDPEAVSRFGSTFIQALQSESSVACALKHFPGHGDTATDSHTGLPSVDKKYKELKDFELSTFQSGIDAGADMIMTAHIQYPNIEKDTYKSIADGKKITLPATLSKTIITGILRTTMDYNGVVTTDALNMDAIAANFDPQDAARLAINAGVDILLMPVTIENSGDIKELEAYIDGIADQVRAGVISEDRINESALRILKLKEKRGVLNVTTADVDKKAAYANEVVGCEKHHETEMEIALRTITLVKNANKALPLKGNADRKTAVFAPYSNEISPYQDGVERLVKKGILKNADQVSVYNYNKKTDAADFADEIEAADQLVVSGETGGTAALTDWRGQFADSLIEIAHKSGKKVIFISTQLPYDAARFQEADGIILSYNPKGTMGSTSGPSFAASLMIAFGYQNPSGRLPVNIPEINDSFEYTDRILYKRGFGMTDFSGPAVKVSVKGTLKLRRGKSRHVRAYDLTPGDAVKSWSTSRGSVAAVSKNGTVRGKKRGTAKITVRTEQGASRTFKVRVY